MGPSTRWERRRIQTRITHLGSDTGVSEYRSRIESLAEQAKRDRQQFDPPADPPDAERAMAYLREGVGEAVWCYIEARTGEFVRFDADEFELLEGAMNEWFELYARCYGIDIEAEFTVREAAELLVETHNIHDVARLLTHVPDRRADA